MIAVKTKILENLKELPERKLKDVLNFVEYLRKEQKKKVDLFFKTARLGRMKTFNRRDLYNDYLSNRF